VAVQDQALDLGGQIIARHDRFMTLNYPRLPVAMVKGTGCTLTDASGKEYLDLFSGFGAGILGHCHEDLVTAATRQMNRLWHVGNLLHTEPQGLLAEQIARHGFGGRSFFCHSGSDANEAAFKLARLYGQGRRHKVIATHGSFHGRGFAAMMATGQEKVRRGFDPLLEGFAHVAYDDVEAVRGAIDDQTVAVIVEPIQGEAGVHLPADDYLAGLRSVCDEHDLLLIVDEVWTGCGRTGRWFAYQHAGIEPDIMTLGKAVGGGLAVGVMCANDKAANFFDFNHYGGVPHATTLGGNAVSTAVSARLFEVIERDRLVERAASLGQGILDRWQSFAADCPAVAGVRGRGLFVGLELNPSEGWFDSAAAVARRALEAGVLVNAAGQDVLRVAPPLVIEENDLDRGLGMIEQILQERP